MTTLGQIDIDIEPFESKVREAEPRKALFGLLQRVDIAIACRMIAAGDRYGVVFQLDGRRNIAFEKKRSAGNPFGRNAAIALNPSSSVGSQESIWKLITPSKRPKASLGGANKFPACSRQFCTFF